MKSELAQEIFALIEARSQARPTSMEFEMAYQARVAIDRIRFAMKHTEQFGPHTEQMREAGLQLLDALERLETLDRQFQSRSRMPFRNDPVENHDTRGSLQHGKMRPLNGRDRREARHSERSE